MSSSLRQYVRAVLVPLGLADRKSFELDLDNVFEDDTFVVSFPKSGNTWVRFIIAYLNSGREKISFREIDQYVADIYSHKEAANNQQRPRFLKSHQPCFGNYPRMIYIVRDYRDVLVSYYHYHVALGDFKGTILQYAQQVNNLHPFGTWKNHVTGALAAQRENPERVLILKFEDLVGATESQVTRIADFIGSSIANVSDAVRKTTFEELQTEENTTGSQFKDLGNVNFFRQGKVGAWRNELPPELSDEISNEHGELFKLLGYL